MPDLVDDGMMDLLDVKLKVKKNMLDSVKDKNSDDLLKKSLMEKLKFLILATILS